MSSNADASGGDAPLNPPNSNFAASYYAISLSVMSEPDSRRSSISELTVSSIAPETRQAQRVAWYQAPQVTHISRPITNNANRASVCYVHPPTSPSEETARHSEASSRQEPVLTAGITTYPTLSSTLFKPPVRLEYDHRSRWKNSWWWWWELGAALISLLAFSSIIIALLIIRNKPLAEWNSSLQINTMIAILTTIGRTAMLVAVGSSISQLKWLHFYKRTAPLSRFQDFDAASRGPWGALVLLRTTNVRALLASFGAFITIFGLAIEPMAQQTVAFPTRDVAVTNTGTVSLGKADVYSSKALSGNGTTLDTNSSSSLIQMQSATSNGVVGKAAEVDSTCPADAASCQWPAFSTIGMCNICQNITNYQSNCMGDNSTTICDYTSPDFPAMFNQRDNIPESNTTIRMLYSSESSDQSWTFASYMDQSRQGVTTVRVDGNITTNGSEIISPSVNIERCTWQWCMRDYEGASFTNGAASKDSFTSEFLGQGTTLFNDTDQTSWTHFNTTRTNRPVAIEANTNAQIWAYLTEPLNGTLIGDASSADPNQLDYTAYLSMGNMTQIASNLADTVTNMMRSQSQDNSNATSVSGTAIVRETYIHVRWPWLILPLLEAVLAAVLLLSTMLISRRRPLWKGSALAPFLHPLSGLRDRDLNDGGADGVRVALDSDESGYLRMMRR